MSGAFAPPSSGGGGGPRAGEIDSLFSAAPSGNFVRKNLAGTAIEYAATSGSGAAWGSITGTLSSQSDLNTALTGRLVATNNLSDVIVPAAARTNLGLAIGSNVQAWDADLDAIAALAQTSGNFIRSNGTAWQGTALVAADIPASSIDDSKISPSAAIAGSKLNLSNPGPIGSGVASTISASDLTRTGRNILTPASTQTLTATSTITVASTVIPISSASSITLTSNPQVATGANGQEIELVNIGSFNISLADGNGLLLGRAVTLFPGRVLRLRYLTTYSSWVDCNFNLFTTTASLNTNNTQAASTAYVNTSNRPSLQAGRSTTFTALGINGWAKVPWNTASSDLSSMLNTSTGDFTIPSFGAGLYSFSVGVGLSANVNGMALSVCTSTLGAEVNGGRLCQMNQSADTQSVIIGNGAVLLAASTTYSIQVFYVAVANVARDLLPTPAITYLTMYRLNV
jgi:hypothetical protein